MTPPDYCLTAICLFPAPTIFLWLQYITYWHHYIFHLFWWQQHTVNEIAFAVKTFIFDAIFYLLLLFYFLDTSPLKWYWREQSVSSILALAENTWHRLLSPMKRNQAKYLKVSAIRRTFQLIYQVNLIRKLFFHFEKQDA